MSELKAVPIPEMSREGYLIGVIECYIKSEVDKVLEEKDAEIADLKQKLEERKNGNEELNEVFETRAKDYL